MPEAIRLRSVAARAALIALALSPAAGRLASAQAPARAAVVTGRVVDPAGAPVHGADVRAEATGDGTVRSMRTDERGRFRLEGFVAGPVRLSARRLGFEPSTRDAMAAIESMQSGAPAGAAPQIEIALAALPTMLQPVVVQVDRVHYAGRLAGYYRRLERNQSGDFITRETIDHEDPRLLSHVLGRVAGVSVGRGRFGASTVRFRGRTCAPLVWLDGSPMPVGEVDLDAISPQSIQGVELYLGATTAPPQFTLTRNANACGTIVLWSRGPDTDPVSATPRTGEELARLVAERQVYQADAVDQRASPTGGMVNPSYPPALFAARQAGAVLAEFVVAASGRVEPETFGIVSATHPLMAEAVERAVLMTAFKPAMRNGLAVRQLVQLPFTFTPPAR